MVPGRTGALGAIGVLALCSSWVGCGTAFTAAGADAGDDGGALDAPPGDVAPVEAEASATWCDMQGKHLFCDDFTAALPSNFQNVLQNSGGTLLEDSADALSPPHSLLATTPSLSQPGFASEAVVTRSFTTDGFHDTLQFAVEISNSCFTTDSDPVTLAVLAFPSGYALALLASVNGAQLLELAVGSDGGLAPVQSHDLGTAIPTETWQTVQIDAMLGTRKVSVLLAGAPALQGDGLAHEAQAAQHATLLLGASVKNLQGASVGCQIHIDNVLFDVGP